MIDPAEVADRVEAIQNDAVRITGHRVALIAVTKTFGCDAIAAAAAAGCAGVGENYAQELLEKAAAQCLVAPVHFIGALQSNKIRHIAPYVDLWQSIDRASVITELARRRPGAAVLLQVNTTGEPTKSGVEPGDVETLLTRAVDAGLSVQGLMTLGPTVGDHTSRITAFTLLRSLTDTYGLATCSMGMSGDYREALECGSTMIRIGSALFGSRDTTQKRPHL